jgi:hypothetical protein
MDRVTTLYDTLKAFIRTIKDYIDNVYDRLTSIEVDQCILEHKTAYDLKKAN